MERRKIPIVEEIIQEAEDFAKEITSNLKEQGVFEDEQNR